MSESTSAQAHPFTAPTDRPASLRDGRPVPALSNREIEVLLAWILSDTKGDVCRRLFIAPGTVNTRIGRIREKYGRAGRPLPRLRCWRAPCRTATCRSTKSDPHCGRGCGGYGQWPSQFPTRVAVPDSTLAN